MGFVVKHKHIVEGEGWYDDVKRCIHLPDAKDENGKPAPRIVIFFDHAQNSGNDNRAILSGTVTLMREDGRILAEWVLPDAIPVPRKRRNTIK